MYEEYKVPTSALELWIKTKNIHDKLLQWKDRKVRILNLLKRYPESKRLREGLKVAKEEEKGLSKEIKRLQM